jgi:hypothetical protein
VAFLAPPAAWPLVTPARLAEIRAYIARLDLDQLPPWTVEQAIIRDLWEALPEAWYEGFDAGVRAALVPDVPKGNPYRADAS